MNVNIKLSNIEFRDLFSFQWMEVEVIEIIDFETYFVVTHRLRFFFFAKIMQIRFRGNTFKFQWIFCRLNVLKF